MIAIITQLIAVKVEGKAQAEEMVEALRKMTEYTKLAILEKDCIDEADAPGKILGITWVMWEEP